MHGARIKAILHKLFKGIHAVWIYQMFAQAHLILQHYARYIVSGWEKLVVAFGL